MLPHTCSNKMEEGQSAWEESRKVRDQVSTLMGQYLLRGYRMLSTSCAECGTVLMKSPSSSTEFCIRCTDIQPTGKSDANKVSAPTNPDSQTAATVSESHAVHPPPAAQQVTGEVPSSLTLATTEQQQLQPLQSKVAGARMVLLARLGWATAELQASSSVEHSTAMCLLIKSCADALKSLNDLQQTINE